MWKKSRVVEGHVPLANNNHSGTLLFLDYWINPYSILEQNRYHLSFVGTLNKI